MTFVGRWRRRPTKKSLVWIQKSANFCRAIFLVRQKNFLNYDWEIFLSADGILCCDWLTPLFTKWIRIQWKTTLIYCSLYKEQATFWILLTKVIETERREWKKKKLSTVILCCTCSQKLSDKSRSCKRKCSSIFFGRFMSADSVCIWLYRVRQ